MGETIIVAFDEQHAPEIRSIRNNVFTIEQQINEDVDFDGQDNDAIHVLVCFQGRHVGTGRMLADGHIGRLAVLKQFRGQGLGAKAVRALVKEAKSRGMDRVYLGSQTHAIGFYEKLGFSAYGGTYVEANIEHVHMERSIDQS